jgi:alkylglycerol monooxygenase
VYKITNPYNFEKYNPQISKSLFIWSIVQFFVLAFFVIYCIRNISTIGMTGVIYLAIVVFFQIFSATELMNRNKHAFLFTLISSFVCLIIYFFDMSCFGMNSISKMLFPVFFIYFFIQCLLAKVLNK